MIRYSIADLENITGIKAHTIRIWEKRYKLIEPHRTNTNIRYYDNEQMRKLNNVASLVRLGMKISKISQLSIAQLDEEVNNRLSSTTATGENYEVYTAQLINHGLEFNESAFNHIFSNALIRFGMRICYEQILLPLMYRVGLYWSTNKLNPAQEHFVSNLVKQKLSAAIDALPPAASSERPSLLFLPQNENHEIGLMMAKYRLRDAGMPVIYLGSNVPLTSLTSTVHQTLPKQLLFFLVQLHPFEQLQEYIDKLHSEFRGVKIFVAAYPYILSNLKLPDNIIPLTVPQDFDKMLG